MESSITPKRPRAPREAPQHPPQVIRLVDGTHFVGVGRSRLWQAAKLNEFPTFKNGKSRLVKLADLVAWATRERA